MNNIKKVKSLRVEIQKIINELEENKELFSRPTSISITKLQESRMWLGKTLQFLGSETPYTEADNINNDIVTPEKDLP